MSTWASGKKRFNAKSEGVAKTVSPMDRRRTTRTRRTVSQSQRAGASGCGASSPPDIAIGSTALNCGDDSTMSRRLFISYVFDRGLVDEHDGNIVADRVNALALDAFQSIAVRLQFHFCFASRASEYFQEFLTNCHGH